MVNKIIQVVLALVIVALGYFLYTSITGPYETIKRNEELTQMTRQRMAQVRTALIYYETQNGRFTADLDSLVTFLKADSTFMASLDSLFANQVFYVDSLPFSPRPPHPRFELAVNDTSRVPLYLLRDPGSDDRIGTLEDDITRLNAASWE